MTFSPQNQSLKNELKIQDSEFSFKEIGNEGLTKQILRKGVTWQTPFSGDQVQGYNKNINCSCLFQLMIHNVCDIT
jgi:hypothetical protein